MIFVCNTKQQSGLHLSFPSIKVDITDRKYYKPVIITEVPNARDGTRFNTLSNR